MSRSFQKTHPSSREESANMPTVADLHIAPIRSSASSYHDSLRRDYSSSTTLPPLRTLNTHARYSSSGRPAALEPPHDPQPSSFSADTFQQPRRHVKSSQQHQHHHQQQPSSSKPRKSLARRDSASSCSSDESTITPIQNAMDAARHSRYYQDFHRDEETHTLTELAWRERQPVANSSYSPENMGYPTPVRSVAGCNELSPKAYASPSAVLHSPVAVVGRR